MRITRALIALVFVSTAACDSTTAPARELPPLATQVWTVVDADNQPLPRIVAQRTLDGDVLEYDILDALFLTIDAEGQWSQTAFVRRFRDGTLHEELTVSAEGSWAAEPSGYVFATAESDEAFIIPDAFTDSFATTLGIDGVSAALAVRAVKAEN